MWMIGLKEGNYSKRNRLEAIGVLQERSSDSGILYFVPLKKSLGKADSY